jgi:hypothetical protein
MQNPYEIYMKLQTCHCLANAHLGKCKAVLIVVLEVLCSMIL